MDVILIFSKDNNEDKFIQDILISAKRIYANFRLDNYHFAVLNSENESFSASRSHKFVEGVTKYDYCDFTIYKNYSGVKEDDEYFTFYTNDDMDEEEIKKEYNLSGYHALACTDSGTDSVNLMRDLLIEYIKINPDHFISSAENIKFNLEHLIVAKEKQIENWSWLTTEEILNHE